MFNNINENELCQPPDCPEDFRIIILKYGAPNCKFISWKIENIYNSNYTVNDSKILYSINNTNLNNSENGQSNETNYYALLDLNKTGTIYFKIKMEINNNFYESEVKQFDTSECNFLDEYVQAKPADPANDEKKIWVLRYKIPYFIDQYNNFKTVIFSYEDDCYFIPDYKYNDPKLIDDIEQNDNVYFLNTLTNIFDTFDECFDYVLDVSSSTPCEDCAVIKFYYLFGTDYEYKITLQGTQSGILFYNSSDHHGIYDNSAIIYIPIYFDPNENFKVICNIGNEGDSPGHNKSAFFSLSMVGLKDCNLLHKNMLDKRELIIDWSNYSYILGYNIPEDITHYDYGITLNKNSPEFHHLISQDLFEPSCVRGFLEYRWENGIEGGNLISYAAFSKGNSNIPTLIDVPSDFMGKNIEFNIPNNCCQQIFDKLFQVEYDWIFFDQNLIADGQGTDVRCYENDSTYDNPLWKTPITHPSLDWSLEDNVIELRADFEDGANCFEDGANFYDYNNKYRQVGFALLTFTPTQSFRFHITWEGLGEGQDPGGGVGTEGIQDISTYLDILDEDTIYDSIDTARSSSYNLYELMYMGVMNDIFDVSDINNSKTENIVSATGVLNYSHPIIGNSDYNITGIGFSHSYGGGDGCTMKEIVGYPWKKNAPGKITKTFFQGHTYTIIIYADTGDQMYHTGAYYKFKLKAIPI